MPALTIERSRCLRSRRALAASLPALAQDVIKIGEINSYKAQPAFLEPYKKGWSWRSKRSMPPAA